jgi:hypothetical protein
MQLGRRCNNDTVRFNLSQHLLDIGKDFDRIIYRSSRSTPLGLHNSRELNTRNRRNSLRVALTDEAVPHYRKSNRLTGIWGSHVGTYALFIKILKTFLSS